MAVLQPGDYVGEMSLIDNEPHSATVRAEVQTDMLALGRALVGLFLARQAARPSAAEEARVPHRLYGREYAMHAAIGRGVHAFGFLMMLLALAWGAWLVWQQHRTSKSSTT